VAAARPHVDVAAAVVLLFEPVKRFDDLAGLPLTAVHATRHARGGARPRPIRGFRLVTTLAGRGG
jgi:hypothetical protein